MYNHSCIKCKTKYEDSDPDPYYCPSCNEEKKKIATELDKKQWDRTPVKSSFQQYDEIAKAKGTRFVNIKDLGITL